MVSESEVKELEEEVEEKRKKLQEKKQKERLEEAEAELKEIRDSAKETLDELKEERKQKKRQQEVENGEAFFCNECGSYEEYPTNSLGKKDLKDYHEEGICSKCHREQRREVHKNETESLLGENPTIVDYTVDERQNDKVRDEYKYKLGALETDLIIETEEGEVYELNHTFDHNYCFIEPGDDD